MNWFRRLFSRQRIYANLSEEMQGHLQEKVEDLVAGGMAWEDALAAARREFGNATLLEERGREVWQWSSLESILRDARLALRQLRRNPGFTLTVLITLTLAIGVNTAVFSMVSALLLRPLPYPEPHRLASLTRHLAGVLPSGKGYEESDDGQDGETWELVRDNVPSVVPAAFSFDSNGVNLEASHQVRYIQAHRISATFFDVLGIQPLLGRNFTQEEDRPNGPNVAILSYELWRSLFSADRNILGQAIHLKGEPYAVVGVMPPGVKTTAPADLWTPLQPWHGGEGRGSNYHIVMRLRKGATWAEVNGQLQHLHPAMFDLLKGATEQLVARPFQEDLAQQKRAPTLILMSAVGFILLIACANLAGLMLVRFTRRADEMATRMALGAPRNAIFRQVIMEPFLLTLGGGAAGIALAVYGLRSFGSLFPPYMLPIGGLRIDASVLAFTGVTTLCTGFFIGLFPALASRRVRIRPSLSGRISDSGAGSGRTRQVLIATEVCLTLLLLAGAGLLIRTLVYLETLPSGFDASNVTTAKASLDEAHYHDPAAFQRLLHLSLTAMQRIPGVESAAVGLGLPYERGLNDGFKVVDGPTAGTSMTSSSTYVTPEYFPALRIPLLAGRPFSDNDTAESEPVVIVNVSFARKYMGSLEVLGRHLSLGKTICSVIGLVGDVKKRPGISVSAPLATEPVYYVPATQVDPGFLKVVHVWFQPSWLVRTNGPIEGLTENMKKALAEADPSLPFSGFYNMDDLQASALSQQRIEVLLLSVLAGLALLLSIVGVYGLVSNLVVQRTREIGIRMALGSTLLRAMAEVGRSGIVAVAYGLGGGLILASLTLRVMRSELYGVRPFDPVSLIAVCVLLMLAALAASFAPTLRIARIDPASTLRAE